MTCAMVAAPAVLRGGPAASEARAGFADDYPRQPAVDALRYVFQLRLRDAAETIEGFAHVTIRFNKDEVDSFDLDLIQWNSKERSGMTVRRVFTAANPSLPFTHADDRLRIDLRENRPTSGEKRTFFIEYFGAPATGLVISENRHGERTTFGDNFPDRARHYLPCIDHPSDKATVAFNVAAPKQYEVVANGALVKRTILDTGLAWTTWSTNAPIATYLMVIGVAEFAIRNEPPLLGIPIATWVYERDADVGLDDFAVTRSAMAYFIRNVGPYPYAKLANVESTTRWGGMENASCIFYPERAVAGDQSFDNTIVHEIAHQWFGNSVTERDWNHIWLSEGFATYFTHLYNEETFGRARMTDGLARDRRRIIRYENRHPHIAAVDEEDVAIDGILSTLTYQKGSWVLHMLRREIGDDAFWRGIRVYYAKYRDMNALTGDLRAVMEEASGRDLKWFFDQWIFAPGHPVMDLDWSYNKERQTLTINLRQVQEWETTFRFPLDIRIKEGVGGSRRDVQVRATKRGETFEFKLGKAPASVEFDPGTNLLYEMVEASSE